MGESAGSSATLGVNNTGADGSRERGRHVAEDMEREWVASKWEKPDRKSYGVVERGGGPEASVVAENPGGGCQVLAGGVDSPRVTNNPVVGEFPRGYETSGVTIKGNGVPGADVRGKEETETPKPPETLSVTPPPGPESKWRAVRGRRRCQAQRGERQRELELVNR